MRFLPPGPSQPYPQKRPTHPCTYWDLLDLRRSHRLNRGRRQRLDGAAGSLRQHALRLHRLHLLLDGDRLHLRGRHQALHLRLEDCKAGERSGTARKRAGPYFGGYKHSQIHSSSSQSFSAGSAHLTLPTGWSDLSSCERMLHLEQQLSRTHQLRENEAKALRVW